MRDDMSTIDKGHIEVYAPRGKETVAMVKSLDELQKLSTDVRVAEMQDGKNVRRFTRTLNLYGPDAVGGFAERAENKSPYGYLGRNALLIEDAKLDAGGEIMDTARVGGDMAVSRNARVAGNTVLMARGGWRVKEGAVIIGKVHLNASIERDTGAMNGSGGIPNVRLRIEDNGTDTMSVGLYL